MKSEFTPKRWAHDLTHILNAAYADNRFPVKVKPLAMDFSRQRFPDDPITNVLGDALPGFEGALVPAANRKKGWGIIYNSAIRSSGRINFTLAHEFGHYLLHRLKYPDGMSCSEEDMSVWDSEYRQVESQANDFAATLLMPLDDFRRNIDSRARPDLDGLGTMADRYDVSLTAATLRWLQYTERRSILVVSRDDFILWARSSTPALKTRAYFKTADRPPIPVPSAALAAQRGLIEGRTGFTDHAEGIWLPEPCREHVMFSDRYNCVFSLLHLGEASIRFEPMDEDVKDTFDRMTDRTQKSFT